jgi:hypothetical protein
MLEEIGRPYRTELLDCDTTMKAAAYLAINPMGTAVTAALMMLAVSWLVCRWCVGRLDVSRTVTIR